MSILKNNSESKFSKKWSNYLTLIFLAILLLLFSSTVFAEWGDDDDGDGGSGMTIGDLSNGFDFKRLGGMAERLAPYGDDLMGDLIDKNTGGISFEHVDVAIPGNSGLEVALRRKISQGPTPYTPYQQGFGDWVLDLPIAYAVFGSETSSNSSLPQFSGGCLNNEGDLLATIYVDNGQGGTAIVVAEQHTDGSILHVPSQGLSGFPAEKKTPSDPKNNWMSGVRITDYAGRCATVAIAPNGTKYKFGKHTFRKAKDYVIPVTYSTGTWNPSLVKTELSISRRYAVFLITEIEDVNGNWVRYEYTSDKAELTRIHSNDGRDIRVSYTNEGYTLYRNSRRISQVTTNGRSWSYQYTGTSDYESLYKVNLPDGRYWSLGSATQGMRAMIYEPHKYYLCLPYDQTVSLKHPDGAVGTFRLLETRHLKAATATTGDDDYSIYPQNIPIATDNTYCWSGKGHEAPHERPGGWPIYHAMSIASKTISGAGLPTASWNFEYRNYSGGSLDQTWTKITGPDGTGRTYTYQVIGADHGLLKQVDVNPTSGTGETFTYEHDISEVVVTGCLTYGGGWGDVTGRCAVYKKRPSTKIIQKHGSDTYTTQSTYNKNSLGKFIDYGYPNEQRRYSSVGGSTAHQITSTTYEHKTAANIIGLTKRVVQNGRELSTHNYDSLGRLTSQTRYGQPNGVFTYHTSSLFKGSLATATDGLGRQIYASNYKRGVAQNIRRSDGEWIYVTVDNNGWMTSSKDAKGYTTLYTRDNMGRLTLINPTGTYWANTSIAYNFSGGGAIQTITKGQSRETVTYDEMYRPILERTQALDTGWSSYINTKYHAAGQVKFKSQASTNPSETKGIDYTYDGLGRIYQERENVAPYATTKHRYYSQNRHRVHDPSGAWTDYYSYGYGGPGNADYRAIFQYGDGAYQKYTYLYKNVWGQLTSLRQAGNSNGHNVNKYQHFYYNAQQRLCRKYVAEQGSTKYQYDAAGQMTAYAKGQSNSGCGTVPASNAKVSLSYDNLGQLTHTNYTDANTPDIVRTYDANGNMLTNIRGSGSSAVRWGYEYNSLNMVEYEGLSLDGRQFTLEHSINRSGHYTNVILPSGAESGSILDGLGRATSHRLFNDDGDITTPISNVAYHASGQIASYNYANGFNYSQTLNNRLLPARISSVRGSTKALDLSFTYDSRGLITALNDAADIGNSRTMAYDSLGQLTSASGPWGQANFEYDSLGNIRKRTLGSRNITLAYDTLNRVNKSIDTGGWGGNTGTRTLAYDARGNVTKLGGTNFVYDYADQPRSVSGDTSGVYVYDGNHKRVKSIVGGATTYNVYSLSGKLMHTRDVTYPEGTDYIHMNGKTVARLKNGAELTYLHNDHLGSPVSSSNSAGAIKWRERYSPFGITNNNPVENADKTGFTGHLKDDATGLNYMQARYYDPVLGRFLSVDPAGFQASHPTLFNRYAYANNNPYSYNDPDGRIFRLVTSGAKIIKRTIKARGNVFKAVKDELIDIVDTGTTLVDPSASVFEKVIAVAELASGIDLPSKKGTPNLPINSRRHGGTDHNARIDQIAENAEAAGATNLRKHQNQIDVNGNVVGRNKPDLQFDLDGTHVNIEIDTNSANSLKHLEKVSSNDPCAVTVCEIIAK